MRWLPVLAAALASSGVAAGLLAAGLPADVILIDLICGAMFGTSYATSTSSTTGVLLPSLPVNVRRYWKNRAACEVAGTYSAAGVSSDHFDQPESLVSFTFPLRVAT